MSSEGEYQSYCDPQDEEGEVMNTTEKVDRHHWHGGKSYTDDDCAICDEVMRRDSDAMLLRTVTTEKVKHTSGPWRMEGTRVWAHYGNKLNGAFLIADSPHAPWGPNTEERIANARLIAASPEMLSALEFAERILLLLRHEVEGLGFNAKNVFPRMQNAIRHAKGE